MCGKQAGRQVERQEGRKEGDGFRLLVSYTLKEVSPSSCSLCLAATLQKSHPFEAALSGQAPTFTFNHRLNKHF